MKTILFALFIFFSSNIQAQKLDKTFGIDGKVITGIGFLTDQINSIAVHSDGKIVAAGFKKDSGRKNLAVARYSPDGSLDKSFGGTGIISTVIGTEDESTFSVAIQADGKILVIGYEMSGWYNVLLIRYNIDGSLDNTFGSDGIFSIKNGIGRSVFIQPDGKILIAGEILGKVFIARLEHDGSFDKSFGTDGMMSTEFGLAVNLAQCLALDNDGKIILACASGNKVEELGFAVLRCHPDGSLDNTFDGDGKKVTFIASKNSDRVSAVAIQADGKILLAGYSIDDASKANFAIARYNKDGSLDNTFDFDGVKTLKIGKEGSNANGIAVQTDGKIILGGVSVPDALLDFTLVRLKADGNLDSTFNGNGIANTESKTYGDFATTMTIQGDGKIILAGSSFDAPGSQMHFSLVRYNMIPTKINTITAYNELKAIPNPFSTKTTIVFNQQLHNATISITNCLGRQVRNIEKVIGERYELERGELPSGVYYMQLTQAGLQLPIFKLLVQD